ncbi:poly(glycerol-phosphate) alpha-glucosyltransferase [Planomicrobium soli]|uniref:Poly(Glycerol-phosphate) alpha-glucosyltransferase n=1 Tax=Planomicrobium soli TaxID=1176648 RepID=A0A2P8GCK0_9BACL|nr:glycosyltransferase [Planomicrobium soli]PSL31701.1 poly(glycerol-phosphate) alpha-glucosyltransferase [Planomicrobium soli]
MVTENKMNYVVTSILRLEFGGRTKALIQRTKNLSEHFGLDFTLVTTNYNANYYKVYNHYYEKGYATDKIGFKNVYDYFSGREYKNKKSEEHSIELPGYTVRPNEKNRTYKYYKDGQYVRMRTYDQETGKLRFDDILAAGATHRKIRYEYNDFGVCHRKIIYKPNTANKLEEVFYDDQGKIYLSFSHTGEDENSIWKGHLLHNSNIIIFKNEKDFFRYAFDHILQPGGVTFCDARILDQSLLNCSISTEKYFVLHNSHNVTGTIAKTYQYLIDHADKADKIIVLTQEQLNDLLDLGIDPAKMTVIPHSMDDAETVDTTSRKPDKKFVFIGRIVPQKQVHHIVHAFSKVVKKHPDHWIEIYGDGKERNDVLQLIDELQVGEHVKMMGRTDNIQGVFQNAIASVISSHYEGFGLVIMESLHYGCPVISYDFKYGPKDLLTDGENGFIIEKDNIDLLAETIIKMIENPISDVKLSNDYYLSSTIEKWGHLLEQ